MIGAIGRIEKWFERSCYGAGYTLDLFLRSVTAIRFFPKRWSDIVAHSHQAAFGSMPVVFTVAFFVGMILAIQTGHQLATFNQEAAIGYVVSAAIVRELGPVFTAIALAGLVGSSYAASIGTMKVSEEVDALEVMSIDPVYFLVMPRVIALTITTVVLTVYADLIGIIGGALVSSALYNVDMHTYYNTARDILKFEDIWTGLMKAAIFGATVASIGCSQGMRAEQGARGVGEATMRSVVLSMIFILIFDYMISWFLL
ncbi:MAG: MlaE family ABC transporter permease [Planctomycetota bacterium]|jgi:phospholipid/cholesterol/gamma-HCH transport system permease protein